MTPLRALPGGRDDQTSSPRAHIGPTGVPHASGPIPPDLTRLLQPGEAVIWWGRKSTVSWRSVGALAGGGLLVLAAFSAVVPELWSRPWSQWWQPLGVVVLPAVAMFVRERASLRGIVVTDLAIVDVPAHSAADRVNFRNIVRVQRDPWTGGVLITASHHKVRIPGALVDDARVAVRSQLRGMIRASAERPDDPLKWLD